MKRDQWYRDQDGKIKKKKTRRRSSTPPRPQRETPRLTGFFLIPRYWTVEKKIDGKLVRVVMGKEPAQFQDRTGNFNKDGFNFNI
jgi:hypothetical protein